MAAYLISPDKLPDYLLRVPTFFHKGAWEIQEHTVGSLRVLISITDRRHPVRLRRHVVSLVDDPAVARAYEEVLVAVARYEGREDLEIAVPTRPPPFTPALNDTLHFLVPRPPEDVGPRSAAGNGPDLPFVHFQAACFATSRGDYDDERDRTYDSRKAEQAEHDRQGWEKVISTGLVLAKQFKGQPAGDDAAQAPSGGKPPAGPPDSDGTP